MVRVIGRARLVGEGDEAEAARAVGHGVIRQQHLDDGVITR